MVKLGYHVSHEQFSPTALLEYVQKAEKSGFDFALSSDHFYPWSEDQGHCGFSWSWLGAAMSRTSFPYGIVCCPCYRYHPAIVAQAAATLLNMFPGRFWTAFGSGQYLNEAITGEKWPAKQERNQKLQESAEVIRKLWEGETVHHHGAITVENARLFTLPEEAPRIVGAAITPETAEWCAGWADALITISQPIEKLEKVIKAWKKGGGENKPMLLKVQLSYDQNEEDALSGAHQQWKTNIFGSDMLAQLRTPQHFEQAAENVTPEKVAEHVIVSNDPGKHVEYLQKFVDMGFSEIVLHNVNKKQELFIDVFGEKVIPKFR